jgi:hypothetical protein
MATKLPQFDLKLEGRAISTFNVKEDIATIVAGLREEKWRGRLTIELPGNGGISAVRFEEIRKMSRDE